MVIGFALFDGSSLHRPKMVELADAGRYRAMVVHMAGVCYAAEHRPRGFIPRDVLAQLHGRPIDARQLVATKVWEQTTGGWMVLDWDVYRAR